MTQLRKILLNGSLCLAAVTIAHAESFSGTLFYTNFNGGVNVNSIDYSYNSVTHALSLTNHQGIASLAGADGIIFDGAGHLLVGGQGAVVYKLNTDGTGITSVNPGTASFHLALSPDASTVYTSNFEGPLDTVPLTPSFTNGTVHSVSGSDGGLTQLAFAPDGTAFYVDGNPNGGGNLGRITLGTDVTDRFATSVGPAHGLIYDSFTGLMTIFGAGGVGSFDPTKTTDATLLASLKTRNGINSDFDQGATDGHGHAFIAGNGQITFIDYSATNDITSAADTVIIENGFGGIDDLAPLSGLGSNAVPEPTSIVLLLSVAATLAYNNWRRRSA